jgi:hypothetical protein
MSETGGGPAAPAPSRAGPGVPAGGYRRLLLAGLPLATGGAVLVAIIFSSDSLIWPSLLLIAGTGLVALAAGRQLDPVARARLGGRIRMGLLAGVAATAAYDVVRYLVVALAQWSVRPFAVFRLFGEMIVGRGVSEPVAYAVGSTFHLVNGLGFAIGYLIVFGRPQVWTAIAWAMVLEAVTIIWYPSWLGITALGEFVSMSLIGHLAYGAVLGVLGKRLVERAPGEHRAGPFSLAEQVEES